MPETGAPAEMTIIDFMLDHPWMTFFTTMALACGIADGVRKLCSMQSRSKKSSPDEGDTN